MRIKLSFALAVTFMLPVFASGQAVRETATLDQSYVFSRLNPCTGETVIIDSNVKTYTRLMIDGNGGRHFHFNGRWQYRAVSTTTGIEYVGTETGNWSRG